MYDLSKLMAAVKPRERSDQYIILSALLSLDAHISPVTAKQVGDLLRLHLGSKAPRTYSGQGAYKLTLPTRVWAESES